MLRLSEAIRLGAMIRRQGYHSLFPAREFSCALGAALEAAGVVTPETFDADNIYDPAAAFPVVKSIRTTCPACGGRWLYAFEHVITHLNDDHRWTREEIADYVATFEGAAVTDKESVTGQLVRGG